MASKSDEHVFDEVMVQVGDSGKFQKYYNIIFNLIFVAVATMASFNPIISLAAPDHWCKVPGRELTNFSIEEWKNLTIPWRNNGTYEFSQCKMYNRTNETTDEFATVECLHGWEYDKTYYTETIVTQENWVCEKNMYPTNLLGFGKIGEILGTLLSQLGDVYGRRPIFYGSIIIIVVGRIGLLLSSGVYLLFVIFLIIGSLSSMPLFQGPLVISVEISSVEDRAFIPLMQCIGWTAGLCLAPMLYWVLGEWKSFILITTLPLILFLFVHKYMIESPRWLASKGQMKKCVTQLRKIAKINNSTVTDKVLVSLSKETPQPEKNFGVMSLFSSCRLAIKSTLVITGWICYMIIYFILFLNVNNLKGNPFMNYFWQGLAELPGYLLGKYLSDAIGRKYTKFTGCIAIALIAVVAAYVLSFSGHVIIISVCAIIMKFVSSVVFYAINLQTLEIYPTCLRQTGYSMGFLVGSVFGIVAPYITFLGTSVHQSLPYVIIAVLAVLGGFSGIFLPETLNEKLPETVAEAEQFGADQKVWSRPRGKILTHKTVPNDVI